MAAATPRLALAVVRWAVADSSRSRALHAHPPCRAAQGLVLLLCALGPEEMSEVRLGPLTPHAVRTLRHIREFLNVQFNMRTDQQSGTIFLSCIGAGLKNINRKVT